jgi:hypothetical protein
VRQRPNRILPGVGEFATTPDRKFDIVVACETDAFSRLTDQWQSLGRVGRASVRKAIDKRSQ